MKILYIIRDISSKNPSGRALYLIANKVAKKHEVTIITGTKIIDKFGKINFIYSPYIKDLGLLISFLTFHFCHPIVFYFTLFKSRKHYDIIHSIDSESFLSNVITFHCCDAAMLDVFRTNNLLKSENLVHFIKLQQSTLHIKIRAIIQKIIANTPGKKIIAISKGNRADIIKYYKSNKNIPIIPNGVEL